MTLCPDYSSSSTFPLLLIATHGFILISNEEWDLRLTEQPTYRSPCERPARVPIICLDLTVRVHSFLGTYLGGWSPPCLTPGGHSPWDFMPMPHSSLSQQQKLKDKHCSSFSLQLWQLRGVCSTLTPVSPPAALSSDCQSGHGLHTAAFATAIPSLSRFPTPPANVF